MADKITEEFKNEAKATPADPYADLRKHVTNGSGRFIRLGLEHVEKPHFAKPQNKS